MYTASPLGRRTTTSSPSSLPQEGAAHGRVDADLPRFDVEFVGPHDAIRELLARVVLEAHPGAEVHLAVGGGRVAHHRQLVEALAEKAHPRVDLAQPLLAVDVLGVLGAIAQRRGVGDLLGHARALLVPQAIELVAKNLLPLGRDVGGARCGGRASAGHGFLDTAGFAFTQGDFGSRPAPARRRVCPHGESLPGARPVRTRRAGTRGPRAAFRRV